MSKKKIIYIVLLVIVVIAIIVGVVIVAGRTERLEVGNKTGNTNLGNKDVENIENTENPEESDKNSKEATVTNLDDGILYSVSDEDIKPEIVIGDNYFDTQMADINLNFSKYDGKTVEIEGMSLTNGPYTFVGRYSTSNICPDCPAGYSYFEYEWHGNQSPELVEEESWLKVKGKFTLGDDNGLPYYYIDVSSMEVMNEKGLTTVNN